MSVVQHTVTAEDLQPYGWGCEACGRTFQPGDTATGLELRNIQLDWRCQGCVDADRPIIEVGLKSHAKTFTTVIPGGTVSAAAVIKGSP